METRYKTISKNEREFIMSPEISYTSESEQQQSTFNEVFEDKEKSETKPV